GISIYKEAAYASKPARPIRYFGNAGCSYDNERELPLSRATHARVAQIIAEERAYGCRSPRSPALSGPRALLPAPARYQRNPGPGRADCTTAPGFAGSQSMDPTTQEGRA